MTLSAPILSSAQRCARLYAIEREYRPPKWRPKALLETLLRQAILAVSNGMSSQDAAAEATTRYLEAAARPGLDTPHDPYRLARDHCAVMQTVLEAVSRLVLLQIKPAGMASKWQLSAFKDESGLLHRWAFVDQWNEDAKYRELHSWAVFGDCCAAGVGMSLHVVELGRQVRGRQHSPWCRAYKHPIIAGRFRFRKVDGSPLESSWKPVWYQDSDRNEPKSWVDLMESDGLSLIHHLDISEPRPEHVAQFHVELEKESARIAAIGPWRETPMWRPACDLPYVCPYQDICFGPAGVDPEAVGFPRRA